MKEKLYAWFERETDKKYMIYFLAAVSFFESVIFPIPVDIFTFSLAALHPKKWFNYGLVATVFSVLGAVFGYFLGMYLFDSFGQRFIDFYGYQDEFILVTELFNKNIFWVMFTSAFTPIPYKVFTIAGGALRVALFPFILASILGRGLRFFAETYLAHKYGKKVTEHIMQKFNTYSLIVVGALVLFIVMRSL
jgi:membrane protein YqaA with SNARE-associated domain